MWTTLPGYMHRQHVQATCIDNVFRLHVRLHVRGACPATCPGRTVSGYKPNYDVPATCPGKMERTYVRATCPRKMSGKHRGPTSSGKMSGIHVRDTCLISICQVGSGCISSIRFRIHVRHTCLAYMAGLHCLGHMCVPHVQATCAGQMSVPHLLDVDHSNSS